MPFDALFCLFIKGEIGNIQVTIFIFFLSFSSFGNYFKAEKGRKRKKKMKKDTKGNSHFPDAVNSPKFSQSTSPSLGYQVHSPIVLAQIQVVKD